MRVVELRLDLSRKQSFQYDSVGVTVGATVDTSRIDPSKPNAQKKLLDLQTALEAHLENWLNGRFNKQFYALKVFHGKSDRAKAVKDRARKTVSQYRD